MASDAPAPATTPITEATAREAVLEAIFAGAACAKTLFYESRAPEHVRLGERLLSAVSKALERVERGPRRKSKTGP